MIPSKVPGSNNPPAPWTDKDYHGMVGMHTTSPKVDYAMGLPGQATSPLQMDVNTSSNTTPMDIGPGVSGSINTERNVNG